MKQRMVWVRVGVLITLAMLLGVVWWVGNGQVSTQTKYLTVRFLDVGQGDSVHIITPEGIEAIVDGGPSSAVLRELAKSRSFFDRTIDVMVATHPDADHISGLVDVLNRYEIAAIVETASAHDTTIVTAFDNAAHAEGVRRIIAQAGQTITLGASTTLRILSPQGDTTNWETNTASVVVQLVYGDVEFMLTGDAPSSIEQYLAGAYGAGLESEVLKLGHHGSDTSSSEQFLEVVEPEYAVVSAGKDNRYGHPHKEVLARAGFAGAQIISTAEQGTITFESDGRTVWLK